MLRLSKEQSNSERAMQWVGKATVFDQRATRQPMARRRFWPRLMKGKRGLHALATFQDYDSILRICGVGSAYVQPLRTIRPAASSSLAAQQGASKSAPMHSVVSDLAVRYYAPTLLQLPEK